MRRLGEEARDENFVAQILEASRRRGRWVCRPKGRGRRLGPPATRCRPSAQQSYLAGDGLACKPGSVPCCQGGDHPSRAAVADSLERPTRTLGRAALERVLSGLAPGGVCRAAPVARCTGGLLPHRFTLTASRRKWRSVLCGTVPRVTPGGCYPPPCSVEPGLSSGPDTSRRWVTRSPDQPVRGSL